MDHAPAPAAVAAAGKGSGWIDHLKWLTATLAIPVMLVLIAHQFSAASDLRALKDSRLRAYSELLNKREEADMGVRSQIFSTLLGNYLSPIKGDLIQRMTVLELLATNFDESLNLSPLFWNLHRELDARHEPSDSGLRDQLSRLATQVKDHQVAALSASGGQTMWTISLDPTAPADTLPQRQLAFHRRDGTSALTTCAFEIAILERDPDRRRVYAVVKSDAPQHPAPADSPCVNDDAQRSPKQFNFWVDEFDFPLIDYTRLSDTERFTLVLLNYSELYKVAQAVLVFFPSSRGGARDRPYLDTVIDSLNAPVDQHAFRAPKP